MNMPPPKRRIRKTPSLGLIAMGCPDDASLRVLAANVQAVININADILDPMGVPEEAFRSNRRQYDVGVILKRLSQISTPKYLRILAVTNVDLCTPILTYVFGEAELGGRSAIISTIRLQDDESQINTDFYYERIVKVALHEIAHTLSLYHCEAPKCLMRFSPKLHHLDDIEICFCERCEFILRKTLRDISG